MLTRRRLSQLLLASHVGLVLLFAVLLLASGVGTIRSAVDGQARTEAERSMRWVTSLAPIMMTTTSGRSTSSRALASCRSRSLDSAPTTERFVSCTRRPVRAATPPRACGCRG